MEVTDADVDHWYLKPVVRFANGRIAGTGKSMSKRCFVFATLLCAAALATPVLARQDGKPVIGFLAFQPGACKNEAFLRGMRELGYADGVNFVLTCRHAAGHYEQLDLAAKELIAARPDIVVVFGHAPSQAAQRATKTIPIVMSTSGEPVTMGFVRSLAHPGGNITGVSYYNNELNSKRLEFLKVAVPGLKQLGVLLHAGLPQDLAEAYVQNSESTGAALGFGVHIVRYSTLDGIDAAFAEFRRLGVQGVFVAPTREVKAEIERIAALERQHRLPVVHFRKTFTSMGGLMSYGPDYAVLYHRTAYYVDRILKGAAPSSLPIEQPARFELQINLVTADLLGVVVPEELRLRADKLIQ